MPLEEAAVAPRKKVVVRPTPVAVSTPVGGAPVCVGPAEGTLGEGTPEEEATAEAGDCSLWRRRQPRSPHSGRGGGPPLPPPQLARHPRPYPLLRLQ